MVQPLSIIVVKQVMQALRVKQRLVCVYHPQSQGIVERVNGTLKARQGIRHPEPSLKQAVAELQSSEGTLNTIVLGRGMKAPVSDPERVGGLKDQSVKLTKYVLTLDCVDALPLALMHYRMQENRVTHLSPHEMLTGWPMPVPRMRGPYRGPSLNTLELELKQYMKQLTAIHEIIYAQERAREEERQHQLKPGDLAYVRKFRSRWNEPRREDPFHITTTSPTALQVEGSSVWYHLNHCTRAIDNRLYGQGGSDDEPDGEAADVAGPSREGAAMAESAHPAEDDV